MSVSSMWGCSFLVCNICRGSINNVVVMKKKSTRPFIDFNGSVGNRWHHYTGKYNFFHSWLGVNLLKYYFQCCSSSPNIQCVWRSNLRLKNRCHAMLIVDAWCIALLSSRRQFSVPFVESFVLGLGSVPCKSCYMNHNFALQTYAKKNPHLIQLSGSLLQSILHLNLSQSIHPTMEAK